MTHPLSSPSLRRGPYGFLIGAALCVTGLVALGTWQLDRLAQKETLIADRQTVLALGTVLFNKGVRRQTEATE